MSRFPTAAHLTSWARFAPTVKESAGKRKGKNATGHGNRYLARTLGEGQKRDHIRELEALGYRVTLEPAA